MWDLIKSLFSSASPPVPQQSSPLPSPSPGISVTRPTQTTAPVIGFVQPLLVVGHGRGHFVFCATFLGVADSICASAVCSFARGQSANKRLERNSRQPLSFRLVVLHIIVSGSRAAVAHPQR